MATGYIGTSQNGWPVYDDAHFQDHAVRTEVEGVGFWSANKDVAEVLDDFTQKYNDRIESITLPVKVWPGYDDWSRALRPVRGQTKGYSNHASCSARDLNSTLHPRGVERTYSAEDRARLRALVNDDLYQLNGRSILRSGEFYNSTIDGMHVEINDGVSPAEVKIVADRIRALRERENDVDWTDEVKVSEADAEIYDVKPNTPRTVGAYIRYAPGVERLRQELEARDKASTSKIAADFKALSGTVTTLSEALTKLQASVDDLAGKLTPPPPAG